MLNPKTKKMFKLTRIKIHEDMSEETSCFSANLYYCGKLFAEVRNRGIGGCHDYTPLKGNTYQDVRDLEVVAATLTDAKFEALDGIVDELLTEYETKQYVKMCTKDGYPYVLNVYQKKNFIDEEYYVLFQRMAFKTKEAMTEAAMNNSQANLMYKSVGA